MGHLAGFVVCWPTNPLRCPSSLATASPPRTTDVRRRRHLPLLADVPSRHEPTRPSALRRPDHRGPDQRERAPPAPTSGGKTDPATATVALDDSCRRCYDLLTGGTVPSRSTRGKECRRPSPALHLTPGQDLPPPRILSGAAHQEHLVPAAAGVFAEDSCSRQLTDVVGCRLVCYSQQIRCRADGY